MYRDEPKNGGPRISRDPRRRDSGILYTNVGTPILAMCGTVNIYGLVTDGLSYLVATRAHLTRPTFVVVYGASHAQLLRTALR